MKCYDKLWEIFFYRSTPVFKGFHVISSQVNKGIIENSGSHALNFNNAGNFSIAQLKSLENVYMRPCRQTLNHP